MSLIHRASNSHRRRLFGAAYNDLVMKSGPIAYWPQDERTGTTAHCLVNPAQNGTYVGVTLANDASGPFGTPAPFYDGTNDYCNIYSATLDAAFDEDEHSVGGWAKVANAGVWADGVARHLVCLSWSNYAEFSTVNKEIAANRLRFNHRTAGVSHALNYDTSAPTDWFFWMMTVSAAANETQFYFNGVELLPAAACAAAAVSGLDNTRTLIGARITTPLSVFHGGEGPLGVWGRPLTPADVAGLYVT